MMSKDNKVNLLPEFGGGSESMWLEIVDAVREMQQVMNTHVIHVLEDGETYSGEPTIAVKVSDAELEEIENGSKVYNVVPDWETRGVK
jgi:hypothetical protein